MDLTGDRPGSLSARNSRAAGCCGAIAKKIWKTIVVFTGLSLGGASLFLFPGITAKEAYCQSSPAVSSSGQNHNTDQKLQELITALQKGNADERQRAAIALSNAGDAGAVEPLIAALDDKDDFVRDFAVRALGSIGDPRAVDPLIKALDDKNLLVRRSAAKALGSIKNKRAVGPLIKALDDDDPLMQRSAVRALGSIGDPAAVDPLVKILGSDDIYISNAASVALTDIGAPAIPGLIDAMADWTIGPRAAEILQNLRWKPTSDEESVRFDVARRDKQALLEKWGLAQKVLLNDANSGNSRQVQNAVFALIGIGRDEVLNDLARILREKGDDGMARAFSVCGNAFLAEAARSWAKDHGMDLSSGANTVSIIEWGKLNSSQIADAAISSEQ